MYIPCISIRVDVHALGLVGKAQAKARSSCLTCVGSIPAIPPTQFTCFIDELNKLA